MVLNFLRVFSYIHYHDISICCYKDSNNLYPLSHSFTYLAILKIRGFSMLILDLLINLIGVNDKHACFSLLFPETSVLKEGLKQKQSTSSFTGLPSQLGASNFVFPVCILDRRKNEMAYGEGGGGGGGGVVGGVGLRD